MGSAFLGEIRLFSFDFAPLNWAMCDGQSLSVHQYQALYSLIGTTYGGDGRKEFNLPDLRGRTPVGAAAPEGKLPEGIARRLARGEAGGVEQAPLSLAQVPEHSHRINVTIANATTATLADSIFADVASGNNTYRAGSTPGELVPLSDRTISSAGGGSTHDNIQPFLTANYCIAVQGDYPPRP